jgi:hypothetical protein
LGLGIAADAGNETLRAMASAATGREAATADWFI